MAQLYRKSALDKLSNPEQLDRMIKISSPMSWLALIAVLLIIAGVVIWSIFGTLPMTETVNGVIVSPDNAGGIYADTTGVVERYYKNVGDAVGKLDKIADIRIGNNKVETVLSQCEGVLSALLVNEGETVLSGSEIARMTVDSDSDKLLVCYAPLALSQKLESGMDVLIYPSSVDSQKYGHMEGEVLFTEPHASSTDSMAYILGSGNFVAEQFVSNGPVAAVICKLKKDDSTTSGLYWSSDAGKDISVTIGTIVTANIVVDRSAPITRLFKA